MTIVLSIIAILLVLSVLALVHELGHFLAARIFHVKVVEFSVFIGPKLFQHQSKKSGTKYTLRLLPLGGYCSFEDDVTDEDGKPIESDNKLVDQAWWKRAIIFAAGVFMNIVLALLVATIIVATTGFSSNRISYVAKDSLADLVGIEAGDELINMNGYSVVNYTDVAIAELSIMDVDDRDESMETHYTLTYKKQDGSKVKYTVSKYYSFTEKGEVNSWYYVVVREQGDVKDTITYLASFVESVINADGDKLEGYRCKVNVMLNQSLIVDNQEQVIAPGLFGRFGNDNFEIIETKNPLLNIAYGFRETVSWVKSVYLSLYFMVKGYVGVEAVSGPVGLTGAVNEVFSVEGISSGIKLLWLFNLAGLISANLAVINFLPFPGLDGFHLLLVLIELIRGGKKVPVEKQNIISFVGLCLLILLAVVIMVMDIFKLAV